MSYNRRNANTSKCRRGAVSSQFQHDNSNINHHFVLNRFVDERREVKTGNEKQGRETTRGEDERQNARMKLHLIFKIF